MLKPPIDLVDCAEQDRDAPLPFAVAVDDFAVDDLSGLDNSSDDLNLNLTLPVEFEGLRGFALYPIEDFLDCRDIRRHFDHDLPAFCIQCLVGKSNRTLVKFLDQSSLLLLARSFVDLMQQ